MEVRTIILHLLFSWLYRLLLTKSCRRKTIWRIDVTADACCTSLGGALCDNCENLQGDNIQLVSRTQEFSIVTDAISDLLNHGIHKVRLLIIYADYGTQSGFIDLSMDLWYWPQKVSTSKSKWQSSWKGKGKETRILDRCHSRCHWRWSTRSAFYDHSNLRPFLSPNFSYTGTHRQGYTSQGTKLGVEGSLSESERRKTTIKKELHLWRQQPDINYWRSFTILWELVWSRIYQGVSISWCIFWARGAQCYPNSTMNGSCIEHSNATAVYRRKSPHIIQWKSVIQE